MNSISNTEKGKRFQRLAIAALRGLTGTDFDEEVKILIGNPPKPHTFDLASADRRYVGECKAFTFTVRAALVKFGDLPRCACRSRHTTTNEMLTHSPSLGS